MWSHGWSRSVDSRVHPASLNKGAQKRGDGAARRRKQTEGRLLKLTNSVQGPRHDRCIASYKFLSRSTVSASVNTTKKADGDWMGDGLGCFFEVNVVQVSRKISLPWGRECASVTCDPASRRGWVERVDTLKSMSPNEGTNGMLRRQCATLPL